MSPSDSTLVVIDGKRSRLIPFSRYSEQVSKKSGFGEQPTLPYVIIPDSELFGFMARHAGYPGKPVNHVNLNGVETIVFTSKEVDTTIRSYPRVAEKPANHVFSNH